MALKLLRQKQKKVETKFEEIKLRKQKQNIKTKRKKQKFVSQLKINTKMMQQTNKNKLKYGNEIFVLNFLLLIICIFCLPLQRTSCFEAVVRPTVFNDLNNSQQQTQIKNILPQQQQQTDNHLHQNQIQHQQHNQTTEQNQTHLNLGKFLFLYLNFSLSFNFNSNSNYFFNEQFVQIDLNDLN